MQSNKRLLEEKGKFYAYLSTKNAVLKQPKVYLVSKSCETLILKLVGQPVFEERQLLKLNTKLNTTAKTMIFLIFFMLLYF